MANLETIIFSGECPTVIDSRVFCSITGTAAATSGFCTSLKNIYVKDELVDEFKEKFGEITYDGTNLAQELIQPISSME